MAGVQVLDVGVPMRDGTRLRADMVLDHAEPRPALLIRTPYSRGAMRLVHDVVGLARGGWAVVVQDVRGRFDSEGVFRPFDQEVEDGHDTVAWCARQPWCDGRVAMTGWSYVGATQWLAALGGHPALKAINPVVGAGDIGEAMLWEGGAFQIGLAQPWALGLAASDPRADPETRARAGQLGARWRELLAAPPDKDPVGAVFPAYAAWRGGARVSTAVTGRYAEVDVAVHQVAGWYDVFCESALRHFAGMGASSRPQRLVIGPWSHSNGLSNLHPEHDFGGAANGGYAGVLGAAIDWNRRVLDGQDVDTGVACFVMGEDRWVHLDSWPPPSTEQLWFLGDEGSLGRERPPPTDEVLVHDPGDPVPTRGGRVLGPWLPMAGPVDQRSIEGRPDVLVHTSTTCERALRVLGQVRWSGTVASTARCFDVVVRLCDVHPDGRVVNVVEGVRRVEAKPGTDVCVEVQVGSTAHVFLPGHRVRVHLAASSSPRLDVTQERGSHTVRLGGRTSTALSLPVLAE